LQAATWIALSLNDIEVEATPTALHLRFISMQPPSTC
jgi:hypothetical protein